MSARKKNKFNLFLKNETVIFFVFKCISGLLALTAVSIRSHFIDKVTYSNYYLIVQSITLLISIFITWVVESVGRYHDSTEPKLLYSTTILNFFASFILGFFALFIMNVISGGNVILDYMPYAVLLLFFNGTTEIVFQIYRMSHQTKTYCFVALISSILNVVIFLFLPKKSGVISLLLTTILINSAVFVFAFFNLKVYKKFSIKSYSLSFTKKCLRYSLPLVVVWGCIWILNSSDTFIINFYYPNSLGGEVGIYNMAHSLSSNTIGLLTSSFSFAVFPKLITIWNNGGKNGVSRNIVLQIQGCCILCIPAIFGLASIAHLIYSSLISVEYNPNGIAVYLIVIFSVINFTSGIANLIGRPWQLEEKTYVPMFFSVASAVINIGLDFLFVYLYGYFAAAIVSAVVIITRTSIMFIIISKRYRISIPLKPIVFSVISSVAMFAFLNRILPLFRNTIVSMVLGVFLGITIYSVLMYFSFAQEINDWRKKWKEN